MAACKNHRGLIKHSEEKKSFSVLENGCRLPVALAGGCWSLPVEGNSIPEPGTSRTNLHPLYTPWHQTLFPLHIQSPQGSTVPATVMGFLIFKALQHPKFISRGNPFHLVTSSQAYLPEVYCSLSWKVKRPELS